MRQVTKGNKLVILPSVSERTGYNTSYLTPDKIYTVKRVINKRPLIEIVLEDSMTRTIYLLEHEYVNMDRPIYRLKRKLLNNKR